MCKVESIYKYSVGSCPVRFTDVQTEPMQGCIQYYLWGFFTFHPFPLRPQPRSVEVNFKIQSVHREPHFYHFFLKNEDRHSEIFLLFFYSPCCVTLVTVSVSSLLSRRLQIISDTDVRPRNGATLSSIFPFCRPCLLCPSKLPVVTMYPSVPRLKTNDLGTKVRKLV